MKLSERILMPSPDSYPTHSGVCGIQYEQSVTTVLPQMSATEWLVTQEQDTDVQDVLRSQ